jgi:hypothetical protein
MSSGRSQFHSLSNQELRERYLAAGFAGRAGWGQRSAILVIDMGGAWTTPGQQLGSDLDGVVGQITRILDVARELGDVPFYFTTMAYD